jgi:hypothetical protein
MRTRITILAVFALLITAASASAAAKPTATTGGHSELTPTSVTLLGKVNPEATSTSYYFQYGLTKAYGTQTGPVAAGSGAKAVNASAPLTGLKPNTIYHFRVVAVNTAGATAVGVDASFTTPKQPLGLSLIATPNPVVFGGPTTVTATLTGTDDAGRTIVLMQRPFPYTTPFAPIGNAEITNSAGVAAFPIIAVATNTQYVAKVSGTTVASPAMTVAVAVIVHLNLHSHSLHSGSLCLFSGTVSPVEDGALYAIQKQVGAAWVTVAGSSLHHSSTTSSKFSIHVRIRHSGVYRVFVGVNDGAHSSNFSTSRTMKVISSHHH